MSTGAAEGQFYLTGGLYALINSCYASASIIFRVAGWSRGERDGPRNRDPAGLQQSILRIVGTELQIRILFSGSFLLSV